ncbi:MAG: hemerythrin domain-containing protein [Acidimicrobiales bacterium]
MADPFAPLKADHRKVEGLFSQFEQTNEPDIARQICDELTVHAMVEEELVYPLLATKVGHSDSEEARAEHEEAKGLISQIEQGLRSQSDVSSLVKELQQAVQHHVEEEEREIFPKMMEAVPKLTEVLGPDVEARRAQLVERMDSARDANQPSTVVAQKG